MKLIALDQNNQRIEIDYATRGLMYICPECKGLLVPHKGAKVIHHFAHFGEHPKCHFAENESREHLEMKGTIAWFMNRIPHDPHVHLESRIGDYIADILLDYRDLSKPIAIECQVSPLNRMILFEKIKGYTKNNCASLYIIHQKLLTKEEILETSSELRIPDWILALYSLYYGRVYVYNPWLAQVFSVKFEKVSRSNNEYYDNYGEYHAEGEHTRLLKSTRIVTVVEESCSLRSLKIQSNSGGSKYGLPDCDLLIATFQDTR